MGLLDFLGPGGIARGILGAIQTVKGIFDNEERTPFTTPNEFSEAVNIGRQSVNASDVPGSQQALEAIDQSANQTIATAKANVGTSADLLGLLAQINSTKNRAVEGQNATDQKFKANARNTLSAALVTKGSAEQRTQALNEQAKQQDANVRGQVQQAGLGNIFDAINDAESRDLFMKLNPTVAGLLDSVGRKKKQNTAAVTSGGGGGFFHGGF